MTTNRMSYSYGQLSALVLIVGQAEAKPIIKAKLLAVAKPHIAAHVAVATEVKAKAGLAISKSVEAVRSAYSLHQSSDSNRSHSPPNRSNPRRRPPWPLSRHHWKSPRKKSHWKSVPSKRSLPKKSPKSRALWHRWSSFRRRWFCPFRRLCRDWPFSQFSRFNRFKSLRSSCVCQPCQPLRHFRSCQPFRWSHRIRSCPCRRRLSQPVMPSSCICWTHWTCPPMQIRTFLN